MQPDTAPSIVLDGSGNHQPRPGLADVPEANGTMHSEPASTVDATSSSPELEAVRAEKAALEDQYRALLSKLTTMRNTLGDKLRQDADELDRREQQIGALQGQVEDLAITVEALKTELITAHEDAEHARSELEQLRSRALASQRASANEFTEREEALREAREQEEKLREESESWRRAVMAETIRREEAETVLGQVQSAQVSLQSELAAVKEERDRAVSNAGNLQMVLEEFQAAKDTEITALLTDTSERLRQSQVESVSFRQRAETAEFALQESRSESDRCSTLGKEVKEKNALIGKLRHEGVILNEHLTEALRRLKKDSNEFNVDRRLVTNVLLSFIVTPRGDTKRFEMLSLLASILGWTDDQREQVGLQKATGSLSIAQSAANTPVAPKVQQTHRRGHTRGSAQGKALDGEFGENETFSSLWIEFLLREANPSSGKSPPIGSTSFQSATALSFQLPDIPTPPSPGSTLSLRSDAKEFE